MTVGELLEKFDHIKILEAELVKCVDELKRHPSLAKRIEEIEVQIEHIKQGEIK